MVVCPNCEREIGVPEIVEIDPDAGLPEVPLYFITQNEMTVFEGYQIAQQDMVKAGWRKVKS